MSDSGRSGTARQSAQPISVEHIRALVAAPGGVLISNTALGQYRVIQEHEWDGESGGEWWRVMDTDEAITLLTDAFNARWPGGGVADEVELELLDRLHARLLWNLNIAHPEDQSKIDSELRCGFCDALICDLEEDDSLYSRVKAGLDHLDGCEEARKDMISFGAQPLSGEATRKVWWRVSAPDRAVSPDEGVERIVDHAGATYQLITNDAGTRSYVEKWVGGRGVEEQVGYVSGSYTVERGREIFDRIEEGDPEYL